MRPEGGRLESRGGWSSRRLLLMRLWLPVNSPPTQKNMGDGNRAVREGCRPHLTLLSFLAEDGSVKMFLRGRRVTMLIPDQLAPTYSLDTRSELPPNRLKLDWVYP